MYKIILYPIIETTFLIYLRIFKFNLSIFVKYKKNIMIKAERMFLHQLK